MTAIGAAGRHARGRGRRSSSAAWAGATRRPAASARRPRSVAPRRGRRGLDAGRGRPPRPPTELEVGGVVRARRRRRCERAVAHGRAGDADADAPAMAPASAVSPTPSAADAALADALADLRADGGPSGAHVPPTAMAAHRCCARAPTSAARRPVRSSASPAMLRARADERAERTGRTERPGPPVGAGADHGAGRRLLGLLPSPNRRCVRPSPRRRAGACVAAGLGLNLAGWWWMRRIVAAPR